MAELEEKSRGDLVLEIMKLAGDVTQLQTENNELKADFETIEQTYNALQSVNKQLQARIVVLEEGLIDMLKDTAIQETRRWAEDALKGTA